MYLPKEFVSNEAIQTQSKQARTPSKENSGGFDSIMGVPGPSAQKPKAAATPKKKDKAPEVSSEAKLQEIKKNSKKHLKAWSDDFSSTEKVRTVLKKKT